MELRFGQVEFYFRQNIQINGEISNIIMAFVNWHHHHPRKDFYGEPVEIWTSSLYEAYGPASFIPVSRIKNISAVCPTLIDNEQVLAVVPLNRKIYV